MNERIQELVSQLDNPVATIGNWGRVEWADNVYPQLGDKMYAAIDLQKFAELIVRECIAIVEPSSYRRAYPENYRGGIDCLEILEEGAAKIKEHFGVEE